MLFQVKTPQQKRAHLRQSLQTGGLLRFPGSFAPPVSLMIEEKGFEGVYLSGSVLAADMGFPDIGLTTLTELAHRGRALAHVTNLPAIMDADTGFGGPLNGARAVVEFEELGLAGLHLEDQLSPKRCGHLDGKQLVPAKEMAQKIQAAVEARRDPNFVIIARTDARAVEGLQGAMERARAYVDAGADMIFPEALGSEAEFEAMRKAIKAPLLANMTEFGKSPLLGEQTLQRLGYNVVIYPVTTFRLAMRAVEDGLDHLNDHKTQEGLISSMQTRQRLYEILRYEDYNDFDRRVGRV